MQLGLVEVVDSEVTARHCYWFRVLGHPWDTISWSHTLHDKHGGKLDRATYVRAPFLVDAWPSIAAVVAGRPVFSYNAGTDMTYLRAAFDAHGAPWPRLDYACAYNVAQTVWGPGKPGYLGGYRLDYVYERVVRDRSPAFEASWGQIGHDPVEDAEATARIVLPASERVGANSVAELLDEAYCPLLRMEPDSCETATTGTRTRRPRPPLPSAKIWERNCATRRAYLEIRRYWRGDPAVLDAHNYPKLGNPPVELQAYVRRRRRW